MDNVSKKNRSRIMRAIKGKETGLETELRKKFWKSGIRYRKNPKGYFGKPDLVIRRLRTVVFFDSCFWHGCPKHLRMPVTNKKYWHGKIARNRKRDKLVTSYYAKQGWKVVRIWEHQAQTINQVLKSIAQ